MTSWMFNGLPLHVLLVHFVVVIVPLAALVTVIAAVWPAARRRLGLATPIIAALALIAVPITTQAGEALERQVGHSELIEEHAELGDTLLPWAVAVFLLAAVQWAWFRFVATEKPRVRTFVDRTVLRRVITIVLALAMAFTAVGSVITVVLIGESGSRAVWTGELDSSR